MRNFFYWLSQSATYEWISTEVYKLVKHKVHILGLQEYSL